MDVGLFVELYPKFTRPKVAKSGKTIFLFAYMRWKVKRDFCQMTVMHDVRNAALETSDDEDVATSELLGLSMAGTCSG